MLSTCKSFRASLFLSALLLGMLVSHLRAQLIFDRDTTISSRIEQPIHVIDGPTSPTTLTIIDPADLESTVTLFGSSTVNMLGGRIDEDFEARGNSILNIRGGTMEEDIFGFDNSTIDVTGGQLLDYLFATGSSRANVRGGSIWGLEARGDADIFLTGGNIRAFPQEQALIAGEGGTIFIAGTGFNLPYGTIFGDQFGTLTGFLQNGDPIQAGFRTSDGGSIVLVPEPDVLGVLLGTLWLL